MSSYSELKEDIRAIAGAVLLFIVVVAVLALLGVPIGLIALPEVMAVSGPLPHDFGWRDLLARGGLFSGIGFLACYAVLNLEMALLIQPDDEVRPQGEGDTFAALCTLNLVVGVVVVILLSGRDVLVFHVLGTTAAYAVRYAVNPLICVLWLAFGVTALDNGRYAVAVVNYAGLLIIGAALGGAGAILGFLFSPV